VLVSIGGGVMKPYERSRAGVGISGLAPSTTYPLRVRSRDTFGNERVGLYSGEERSAMQGRRIEQRSDLLGQAHFTRVDAANVHFILTKDSAYGLDLEVDLNAFEEVLIYYRGATTITERRRDVRRGLSPPARLGMRTRQSGVGSVVLGVSGVARRWAMRWAGSSSRTSLIGW